jgi:hypothetical protein
MFHYDSWAVVPRDVRVCPRQTLVRARAPCKCCSPVQHNIEAFGGDRDKVCWLYLCTVLPDKSLGDSLWRERGSYYEFNPLPQLPSWPACSWSHKPHHVIILLLHFTSCLDPRVWFPSILSSCTRARHLATFCQGCTFLRSSSFL